MPKEIVTDIELLVEFAYKHFTEDREVDIASNRVKEWLEAYQVNQDDHGTD